MRCGAEVPQPQTAALTAWLASAGHCTQLQVCVHGAEGQLLGSFATTGDDLGIRAVQWGPGGDVLAVGAHDSVRGAKGGEGMGTAPRAIPQQSNGWLQTCKGTHFPPGQGW